MNGTVEIKTPPTGPTAPTPEPTPALERPKWLPEKFKSPEDMATAYGELEKKMGSQSPAPTPTPTPTTPAATPGIPPLQPSNEPADFSQFEAEFAKEGKLSDTSYQTLASKHNLTRPQVDAYIEGQRAKSAAAEAEVYSVVGGKDNYGKLAKWAESALSKPEQEAFNKVVKSGDTNAIKLAVAGLNARHMGAYGQEPNLSGGRVAPAGPKPFNSWDQVTRAMASREYKEDPAFREEVQQRMAVSNI